MISSDNICISCHLELEPCQPAIQCERCSSWQHRTCASGVSHRQYRQAAKGEIDLAWKCTRCVKLLSLHRRSPLRRFEKKVQKTEKTTVVTEYDDSGSEEDNIKNATKQTEDTKYNKTGPQRKRPRRLHFYSNWLNLFTIHNLKKLQHVRIRSVVLAAAVSAILAFILRAVVFMNTSDPEDKENNGALYCYRDYVNGGGIVCRPRCKPGFYSLPYMQECQKYLSCKEIQSTEMKILDVLGGGAVKGVYLAKWQDKIVAYNSLQNPIYRDDFNKGLGMLHEFQSSHKVTQLIGYCKTFFITEYQSLGDATKFESLLKESSYSYLNTLSMRFKFCINYVEIIEFFHTHPAGTRVFCDSNTLTDTLQQYLITHSFTLIANDLDALPLLKKGSNIKCGSREIVGEFAAPEQRWPDNWEEDDFNDKLLPGYNEKIDIWKIPDVCFHFLGLGKDADILKLHLFKIHKSCKSENPKARPCASDVLKEYKKIQSELKLW